MTVALVDLKNSVRVDSTDDDNLLTSYLLAAQKYVTNAVGADDATGSFYTQDTVSSLYDVAVLALATGYYTYRTPLSAVSATPIDLSTNSIIGQLRGLYDEWEVANGN